MKKTSLKVSIVIPAYNEESHIADCLRSISRLSKKPHEVIVVDNNSTDDTVKVVEQFPVVKLVHQKKQGVVYARDLGFDIATGDIIARLDGDTIIPANWTELLDDIFSDVNVQAVSGSFHFYDVGISQILDAVEGYLRGWMARKMSKSGRIFLNASNMAIRKTAWEKVRSHVCHQKGIHEDLDLALHLYDANLKVVYAAELKANVSARRVDTDLVTLVKYASISPITYIKHDAREHIYMYPEIAVVMLFYPLLRLVFRAYDSKGKRLSLKVLLQSQSAARVNPADFVG